MAVDRNYSLESSKVLKNKSAIFAFGRNQTMSLNKTKF